MTTRRRAAGLRCVATAPSSKRPAVGALEGDARASKRRDDLQMREVDASTAVLIRALLEVLWPEQRDAVRQRLARYRVEDADEHDANAAALLAKLLGAEPMRRAFD